MSQLNLPVALKGMLNFASPDRWWPLQLLPSCCLAHKYIAGENVKQVLKTIERLHQDR